MKIPYKIIFLSVLLVASLSYMVHAAGTSSANCGLASQPFASQLSQNEPWYCPINQQIYAEWKNYLPLTLIVIFLSFGIASIIFMTGVALNSNRIRNFGIGEVYEALATTIIIAAFLYMCSVMFGILPGTYVGNINPYATSFHLIDQTIATAEQMYSSIFKIYLALSYSVSPTISLKFGGAIGSLSQEALNAIGLLPQLFVNLYSIPTTIFFLDPARAVTGFISDGIAVLYAEYYLLVFFSVASIPVFLIPGVFFRAVFPTRALGGIMIALAFGFYLIMPSLFAVAYYFTTPTVQRDMGAATLQMERLGNSPQGITSLNSPLAQQLLNVKSSMNGFWLMILFYPPLIIAVTYAAVTQLANFIGRAVNVGTKMRSFI